MRSVSPRLCTFALFFFISCRSPSQSGTATTSETSDKIASTPAIPMALTHGAIETGRIHIPCSYNGFQDNCYLDTGSSHTSVALNEVSRAVAVTGTRTSMSASGIEKAEQTIVLQKFQVGPLVLQNFGVDREDKADFETRVGINAFRGHSLSFDFKRNELHVDRPSPAASSNHRASPLYIDRHGLTYVEVSVGAAAAQKAMFDTGAEITTVNLSVIAQSPTNFEFIMDIEQGRDANGNLVAFKLYRCKDLRVGGMTVSANVLAFDFAPLRSKLDADVDIILGYNIIRKFDWHIDLVQKQWNVRP